MPVMVKDKGVLFARASLNVAMMAWMEVATVKGDKDRKVSLLATSLRLQLATRELDSLDPK